MLVGVRFLPMLNDELQSISKDEINTYNGKTDFFRENASQACESFMYLTWVQNAWIFSLRCHIMRYLSF